MNPVDRMERAVALRAIADATEKMEKSGAPLYDVRAFAAGAREKLAAERPDYSKYASAATSAAKWAKSNI